MFIILIMAGFVMAAKALAGDITVIAAHARASLTPNAPSAAVYVTLHNQGVAADVLISASTDAADVAMLHESKDVNGMMEMRHLERVELAAGATLDAAGGMHIMLMGLKAPLKQGETLKLGLKFEKAGALIVDVPVVSGLGAAATTD